MGLAEERDIVIIGGGICGLATALALHRKGIRSVILERSETIREEGAAFAIYGNGWHALNQLGVASTLRPTSIPFQRAIDVWVDKGTVRETPVRGGEARCLKRIDLVQALADELPFGTILFGCQVVSVDVDKSTSNSTVLLQDGTLIKAKMLIGCDGANSGVAKYMGLKPTQPFHRSAVRGLTVYPNGYGFSHDFMKIRKDTRLVGLIPIDEHSVYWFIVLDKNQTGKATSVKEPASIKQLSMDAVADFPKDIVEMVNNSELSSLSLTKVRFRAPWNLLLGNFRKETMTVAGDAWHVMGPFLGQGGSAALEDAIVLARCLSKKLYDGDLNTNNMVLSKQKVIAAIDEYLKERKMRVLNLSFQTYIIGHLFVEDTSWISLIIRFICIIIVVSLFRDPYNHAIYHCGEL